MKNISKEVLSLAEIASSIASDNLNLTESKMETFKSKNFSSLKLYETILQSYLFCGFPAAIESLRIFRNYYPDFKFPKSRCDLNKFKAEGKHNCKLIYKKNYKKLIENMKYFSPDLKDWMIIEGYGKVLGRKGLSLLEREYINVSILMTRLYLNQLHSHLKGCIHLGANKELLSELLSAISNQLSESSRKSSEDLINKIRIH
jgi:alkylhydroperoxidase/carboxymuconolactone decarboxylase family protein YurZ